ncbi:uncharacterized protein LOC133884031 [Phragmites australis]|uniref:uncharacterized protein LOC133884031 n=1 Tax=Phragmites australis TaxID=29695 RepID=UPI002D799A67|nr:uncharacterized protein LOC133884031 [Phragmites australis]
MILLGGGLCGAAAEPISGGGPAWALAVYTLLCRPWSLGSGAWGHSTAGGASSTGLMTAACGSPTAGLRPAACGAPAAGLGPAACASPAARLWPATGGGALPVALSTSRIWIVPGFRHPGRSTRP